MRRAGRRRDQRDPQQPHAGHGDDERLAPANGRVGGAPVDGDAEGPPGQARDYLSCGVRTGRWGELPEVAKVVGEVGAAVIGKGRGLYFFFRS